MDTCVAEKVAPILAQRHKLPMKHSPAQSGSATQLADLVRRIADRKDRAAFMELFDLMAPKVKGFLVAGGATEDVAEDVMQEVMLKIWRRAGTYDPAKASVNTWVYRIARNARIDRIRKETRPEYDPEDPALQPTAEPAPDANIDHERLAVRLRASIEMLPPQQREVITLFYYDDMSHGEIAEKINIPFGTVKSRLRLAMTKIKNEMKD